MSWQLWVSASLMVALGVGSLVFHLAMRRGPGPRSPMTVRRRRDPQHPGG